MKFALILIGTISIWMSSFDSYACRFNVRDVGMVDFSSIPYRLYGIVDDSVSEKDVATIQQISYASMIDSNIETEIVHVKNDQEHRAIAFYKQVGSPALPALVFVSPTDEPLHVEWKDPGAEFKNTVWNTMEYISDSIFRTALLQECIDSYGVVLHISGKRVEDNRKVKAVCSRAVEKVTEGMDDLPKDVKNPPVYINLLRKYFQDEKIFLWSYGINAAEVEEPMVAIVYGRGRQIGKILKGDEITVENVLSILSVIGLSCECGLDRSWMMGTMYPLVWNDERRSQAMANVGFDTESPMVITEISQIMSKGSTTQKKGNGAGYSSPDPLLGYAEISLEDAGIYEDAALMREANLREVVEDENNIHFIRTSNEQSSIAEQPIQIIEDENEIAANISPDTQTGALKENHTKVDYRADNGITHRLKIKSEPGNEEDKLRELALGITGKTSTENDEQQVNIAEHKQPNYELTTESDTNIPAIMFTVFGILGGVAILSGVVVLLLARGRQV